MLCNFQDISTERSEVLSEADSVDSNNPLAGGVKLRTKAEDKGQHPLLSIWNTSACEMKRGLTVVDDCFVCDFTEKNN